MHHPWTTHGDQGNAMLWSRSSLNATATPVSKGNGFPQHLAWECRGLVSLKWTGAVFLKRRHGSRWHQQSVFIAYSLQSCISLCEAPQHCPVTHTSNAYQLQGAPPWPFSLAKFLMIPDGQSPPWFSHRNLAPDGNRFQCPLRSLLAINLRT